MSLQACSSPLPLYQLLESPTALATAVLHSLVARQCSKLTRFAALRGRTTGMHRSGCSGQHHRATSDSSPQHGLQLARESHHHLRQHTRRAALSLGALTVALTGVSACCLAKQPCKYHNHMTAAAPLVTVL